MSRTYHPRSKKAHGNIGCNFDVNVHGTFVLGRIMKAVDCHSKSIEEHQAKFNVDDPCTPFKMTAAEAREAAKKLKALTPEQKEAIYRAHEGKVWSSKFFPLDSFIWLFDSWANFLETCSGYRVPG